MLALLWLALPQKQKKNMFLSIFACICLCISAFVSLHAVIHLKCVSTRKCYKTFFYRLVFAGCLIWFWSWIICCLHYKCKTRYWPFLELLIESTRIACFFKRFLCCYCCCCCSFAVMLDVVISLNNNNSFFLLLLFFCNVLLYICWHCRAYIICW